MQNVRNVKLPSAGVIASVVQTVVFGGGATYGLYNSLFNVEGGHRAIVYNRVIGIKDKVRSGLKRPRERARECIISSNATYGNVLVIAVSTRGIVRAP